MLKYFNCLKVKHILTQSISYTFNSKIKQSIICNYRTIHQTPKVKNNQTSNILNSINVSKDVVIYKYENPRFYKLLNIFAICQFFFWNYLSHFAFTTLKDSPVEKIEKDDRPWYRKINLGSNQYRNSITVFCFLIGYGILATAWMFTLRSLRFVVLRKGGLKASFVTYGPFGKNVIMDVPLNCISAQSSRQATTVLLPIKVKNKAFYYVLDMRGEFLNTKLYDYSVGLKRKL